MAGAVTVQQAVAYRDWKLSYGEPKGQSSSESDARSRYAAGERLTLLVGDEDRPSQVAVLDLGGRVAEVVWLDAVQRRALTYVFAVKEVDGWPQDTLLLETVRTHVYDGDTPLPDAEPSFNEVFHVRPDGSYTGSRATRLGDDLRQTAGVLDAARFEAQLEPVPAFGDWASILRRER